MSCHSFWELEAGVDCFAPIIWYFFIPYQTTHMLWKAIDNAWCFWPKIVFSGNFIGLKLLANRDCFPFCWRFANVWLDDRFSYVWDNRWCTVVKPQEIPYSSHLNIIAILNTFNNIVLLSRIISLGAKPSLTDSFRVDEVVRVRWAIQDFN